MGGHVGEISLGTYLIRTIQIFSQLLGNQVALTGNLPPQRFQKANFQDNKADFTGWIGCRWQSRCLPGARPLAIKVVDFDRHSTFYSQIGVRTSWHRSNDHNHGEIYHPERISIIV
jgi:hypothetical protein